MTNLIALKAPRARFARSINVERDAGSNAIDGYLPVGRAIDTIARLASALTSDDVEVALSITGPYGSGKSSLAVVIDALLGPATEPARVSAQELLAHTAPSALETLDAARRRLGAHERGFIRAVVTAQREPIVATVLRALMHGVERYQSIPGQRSTLRSTRQKLRGMLNSYVGDRRLRPETRDIRAVVAEVGAVAPVLLLIDEFGKNLEALADSHTDADLFLLQELAEWTRGSGGLPLALVTLQHMAFDEYAAGATAAQRREWVKIQGRFEDIPFVDSPAQTRALIAAAFEDATPPLTSAVEEWAKAQVRILVDLGLNSLAADPELLERTWPLHPVALAALPELCERYGQNERTLFSFLAGGEPRSVATFLAESTWDREAHLPVVRLDTVYDYFLESASTMVGVSAAASRWVEIDTRIRDAYGLNDASLRVLKTVGLLNLVSAGGLLRASKALITYVAADGRPGTASESDVQSCLKDLERRGLVTFRDFADEYRVWQGSDFDLKAALDRARRRLRDEPAAGLLDAVLPLPPLVAARHSHMTGTLRAFARSWVAPETDVIEPLGTVDRADGVALYVLGPDAPVSAVARSPHAKPVAFITTADASALGDAAREVAAIEDVLATDDLGDDWVARRELGERLVEARSALAREFESAYGMTSAARGNWTYLRPTRARRSTRTLESLSASQAVSAIADDWYDCAPTVRNDLVNRHDLSSQAAKARRVLLEAMLEGADREALGIEGHGPDNTMYRSVLRELGLHRRVGGSWRFFEPSSESTLWPAWGELVDAITSATGGRLRLTDLYDVLAAPPYGVRTGVAPILTFTALIVYADEVALYEHGTFRPALTPELVERLLRNPANFEIKYFASRTGIRAEFLTRLADALEITTARRPRNGRVGSVLAVVSHLVAIVNALPEFAKKTGQLSPDAIAVRRCLLAATEPDELLFTATPEALGEAPIPPSGDYDRQALDGIATRLSSVARELQSAYARLLEDLRSVLKEELRGPDVRLRERLAARASEIEGKVIDPRVSKLVVALRSELDGLDEWTEYVAMNVTGTPPAGWTEEDRRRFSALVHDIGSTFRRIEALNAELRAGSDGFDALRVTVTRPDGTETAKLVWLDDTRRTALTHIIDDALVRAREKASSDAEARDLLLALLAEGDIGAARQPEPDDPVSPRAYSDRGDTHGKAAK